MPVSTTEIGEIPGRSRRSKRSSDSSVSQHSTWVILNKAGGRRDNYAGDRTTSSTCRTSDGERISVSFDLVEPPGSAVLIVDRLETHGGPAGTHPEVVAADGNAVLFRMTPTAKNLSPFLQDYFVYEVSSSGHSRRPSLSRLPTLYCDDSKSVGGRHDAHIFLKEAIGVLSCTEESFIVAELEMSTSASEGKVTMQISGSDEWTVFERVRVRRASGRHDMVWWSTDAVVPYRRRFLIWVDYYRGMIVADMSTCSGNKKPAPPELRFVPLPVDVTDECPDDIECGRGCPQFSRSVCATRSGIKFVSVDHQAISSFGVGKMKRWRHTFRITTWSLLDGDYTWRREARLYEEEFWALDTKNQLARVRPRFPVVNMENPDAVCFLLDDSRISCGSTDTTWMIEVDMKKKVLRAATICSDETSFYFQDTIKVARRLSLHSSFISSAFPRYLYGGEACKKVRRQ